MEKKENKSKKNSSTKSQVARSNKSEVQSVIFGKNWAVKDARKWLKTNGFKSFGRVQKPKKGNSKKYIIKSEKDFKLPLGFKKINNGISFIIGSLK